MAEHTSGPWSWTNDPYEDGTPYVSIVSGAGHYPGGFDLRGIVSEADAKLIAAAPDLLAALGDLLAMCERQTDFNDDGDGRQFERCRAALAKATGQEVQHG